MQSPLAKEHLKIALKTITLGLSDISNIKKENIKVSKDDPRLNIVRNNVINGVRHYPKKLYKILSKNDFGKNQRINAGIFNKKTNFIISETDSLIALKNPNCELELIDLKKIKDQRKFKDYFLIYPIPIFILKDYFNNEIELRSYINEEKPNFNTVKLTFKLGYKIGTFLRYEREVIEFSRILRNQKNSVKERMDKVKELLNDQKKPELKELYKTLRSNLDTSEDKIENNFNELVYIATFLNVKLNEFTRDKIILNKDLILSSNLNLLLGFLYGFFSNKVMIKDINLYNLIIIFNLFGASYSVRKIYPDGIEEFKKQFSQGSFVNNFRDKNDYSINHIRFKLPPIFKNYLNNLIVKEEILINNYNETLFRLLNSNKDHRISKLEFEEMLKNIKDKCISEDEIDLGNDINLTKNLSIMKLRLFRKEKYFVRNNKNGRNGKLNEDENSIKLETYIPSKNNFLQKIIDFEYSDYSEDSENLEDLKLIKDDSKDNSKLNLIKLINIGYIELINFEDLIFNEVSDQEEIAAYDFITEARDDATNYMFPGTPLLKNSDGDIINVIALWTKDAAEEADEKFGIKSKKTTISPLTGDPYMWIGIDSILGLYNFTN